MDTFPVEQMDCETTLSTFLILNKAYAYLVHIWSISIQRNRLNVEQLDKCFIKPYLFPYHDVIAIDRANYFTAGIYGCKVGAFVVQLYGAAVRRGIGVA